MWHRDWSLLSLEEREQFSRIVNGLLAKTFLLRERMAQKDKSLIVDKDFRFVERYYQLCKDFLNIAGWELEVDSDYGVAFVVNRYGYNRFRLDKVSTYFLYALRLIYEEERDKLTIGREVITTVANVVQKLHVLGLLDRKITENLLAETFGLFKEFNIIEKLDHNWLDPESRVLIYPSILFVVSSERIDYVYQQLCKKDQATVDQQDEEGNVNLETDQ